MNLLGTNILAPIKCLPSIRDRILVVHDAGRSENGILLTIPLYFSRLSLQRIGLKQRVEATHLEGPV
jgi:hypothetical protein